MLFTTVIKVIYCKINWIRFEVLAFFFFFKLAIFTGNTTQEETDGERQIRDGIS